MKFRGETLDNLQVEKRFCKDPKIITLFLRKSNFKWIKINTNGWLRGNLAREDGIARDHKGDFWGAFVENL